MTERKNTPGLARALAKRKDREPCKCGYAMPVYPGAYPKSCPECGNDRTSLPPPKEEGNGKGSAAA